MVNICVVYPTVSSGCSLYRLELPHGAMSETYDDLQFYSTDKVTSLTKEELQLIDIFIFTRQWVFPFKDGLLHLNAIEDMAKELRKYGAKIIVDIDDYWELTANHPFYGDYQKFNVKESVRLHMRVADVVTTTQPYLASKIQPYNKNVHIFENCPWTKYEQYQPKPTKSNLVRFGYFGASQHLEDIETVEFPFRRLARDNSISGRWRIYLAGWRADNAATQYYENVFTDNGFGVKNYGRIKAADVYSFMQGYNEVDVSIAPLRDTEFNRCKSDLKIIEAGYMKKAIIVTNTIPYLNGIKDGVEGFLIDPNKPKEWYSKIKWLINNPEAAAEMGEQLHQRITAERSIHEINERRYKLYKSMKRGIS